MVEAAIISTARTAMDAWAYRSHQRAIAAMCAGGGMASAVMLEVPAP